VIAPASDPAIGGYFSLESSPGRGLPVLDAATGFQSARAAVTAILRQARPSSVWLPNFICGAVGDAVRSAGVTINRYPLQEGFRVPANLALADGDWLLCVDYFGLAGAACDEVIARYGADRILVDASQALFHRPRLGVPLVHSPRRFGCVPGGGLSVCAAPLSAPGLSDEAGSAARCQHLLSRLAQRVETGYQQFQAAEASLQSCEPESMSSLTRALLASTDFERVAATRLANYHLLASELRRNDVDVAALPGDAVPMCCPVFGVDAEAVRTAMAAVRIFLPNFWPDAMIPATDRVGEHLSSRTVYLPCDQRYDEADMHRVAKAFLASRGTK